MRILLAFIITVIIYVVLIVLYVLYFQNIKVSTSKKESEHIIKIDIRDIPRYVKKIEPQKIIKKKIIPKKIVPKKVIKKVVKKVVKKKKIIKKEESEASAPKKPKTPIFIEKEEMVEYLPEIIEVEERFIEEEYTQEETIEYASIEPYVPPEIILEEAPIIQEELIIDNIIAEEDMLYIPNPIISKNEPTKASRSLASLLGQSSIPVDNLPKSPLIQKLYGTSFDSFTPIQKKFIVDKLGSIHHITQSTLTRRGYPAGAVAMQTGQEGENIVSFDLHPNGDISNLRLEREIGYRALDENTLQTIRIAYKDYPYPTETTHIVFYVEYSIFGY
jgi:TonB family protein